MIKVWLQVEDDELGGDSDDLNITEPSVLKRFDGPAEARAWLEALYFIIDAEDTLDWHNDIPEKLPPILLESLLAPIPAPPDSDSVCEACGSPLFQGVCTACWMAEAMTPPTQLACK